MLLYLGIVLFICFNFIGLEVGLDKNMQCFCIFLLMACIGVMLFAKKKFVLGVCSCMFFISLGLFNGSRDNISAEKILVPHLGKNVIVQGLVDVGSVKAVDKGYSLIIECEQVLVNEEPIDYRQRLRIYIDKSHIDKILSNGICKYSSLAFIDCGAAKIPHGRIIVSGVLEGMSSFRNPGSFDSQGWNRVNKIGGRLKKVNLLKLEPQLSLLDKAALINHSLRDFLNKRLSSISAPLLSGMVFGGSSNLDEEAKELFVANGIAHLLSVSGAHLVLLASVLTLLLRPVPVVWRKLVILLILFVYSGLCGFKPPIMRALCMSAVALYGGSGVERGLLLGITAVALLLYKPIWLLDLGFQLSFLAVAGIIWLQPKCQQLLNKLAPTFIGELGAVTLAAQLAVIPLEIGYFHQISIISVLSNLCLVPVLEIAVFLTLGGMALGSTFIGQYLFLGASFLTEQIMMQASWLAGLPFSTVVIGFLPQWCGIVYYVWLIVWADVPIAMYLSNNKRRYILLMSSSVLAIALFVTHFCPQPMKVYFLDVGQGDCAVVVTPKTWTESSKVIVFDTGGLRNYSTGSKILAPFLRTLGKREIDMLVLSHYDFDHVGGAADLSRVCNAKQVLLPKELVNDNGEKLLRTLGNNWKKCNFSIAENGKEYVFDDVVVKLVDVPKEMATGNEASTLAEVSYKNFKLLFTGDMGEEREGNLSTLGTYDVLKAGHHGSRYSSSDAFLKQVRPKFTVISCGAGNRYGHPHQKTLERLAFYGSEVLRTDKNGCIKLVFEDDGIKAYGYREGDWIRI